MKKCILLLLFPLQMGWAHSQALTLDSCIRWAKQNYPLIRQNQLLSDYSMSNLKTINENWYPKLSFLAKGVYQTEVVSFNIPGINTQFPHDSYLANVSLDQTLFDGGQTREQKQVEMLNNNLEVQKNEVELYKLVDRVSQLYINALLSRENLKVLNIYKDDLGNRRKNLTASLANGMALQSTLDELDAEVLKTEQSIFEAEENLRAVYKTLSVYIGRPVNDQTELSLIPVGGSAPVDKVSRPELKMLDIQEELVNSRYRLTTKMALPRISLSIGANYGRPGPNFINQNLRFFGDAGLSVKWNIGSLYGLSKEKTRLEINKQMIDVQRQVFLFNLENTLNTQTAQISSLKDMISKDEQIIGKRHNVTATATNRLENGDITLTDYLTQLNAEMQAMLNQKIHEIKLMNAVTNYNATQGITNF